MAVTDKGASVLARLKNRSKETKLPMQMHLRLFCQEEFMRRLSKSRYADNLILKGGLQINIMTNFESRATIDADFLLKDLPNSTDDLKRVVNEIISVKTGNDFIELAADSFEVISPKRKYAGVSCKITAKINNTKTPFTIDFGVGDVIVPKPEKRIFPVQLEGFETPEVITYSLESTIAEKFESAIEKLELNSRMKDFYDIYYLACMYSFDGRVLQEAVYRTFEKRGTPYNRDSLIRVVGMGEDSEMNKRWQNFLKQLKQNEPEFKEVLDVINRFLEPIWSAMIEEDEFFGEWDNVKQIWE